MLKIDSSKLLYGCIGIVIGAAISSAANQGKISQSETAKVNSNNEPAENVILDRKARLAYIRYDAQLGKLLLEDVPDDKPVSSSKIKWVAGVLEDLSELQALATDFMSI